MISGWPACVLPVDGFDWGFGVLDCVSEIWGDMEIGVFATSTVAHEDTGMCDSAAPLGCIRGHGTPCPNAVNSGVSVAICGVEDDG